MNTRTYADSHAQRVEAAILEALRDPYAAAAAFQRLLNWARTGPASGVVEVILEKGKPPRGGAPAARYIVKLGGATLPDGSVLRVYRITDVEGNTWLALVRRAEGEPSTMLFLNLGPGRGTVYFPLQGGASAPMTVGVYSSEG